jgi:8-oxo-dGTP pyrophosphatase MutT (NUDIX family)
MNHRHKVYAYITRGDQLLVFRHIDFPGAGIQTPGGTIEEGEEPEDAVLREAVEETGLVKLRLVSHLVMSGLCRIMVVMWNSTCVTFTT